MKALTTAGLTKLIQLIKNSFISTSDTVTTNTVTLATVATTGDFDDLINQPTIGNGTITINQGGTQKGTFTTNQSGNTTINLDAGGSGTSDVFIAEYGVTTYSEITSAINNGKTIFCKHILNDNGDVHINYGILSLYNYFDGSTPQPYTFNCVDGSDNYPMTVTSSNVWSNDSIYFANASDILTKQDTLVSGTNIKTINNTSLLGSGNIDTNNVFIAEWGETTYAEVTSAINSGKSVFCRYIKEVYENNVLTSTITYYATLQKETDSGYLFMGTDVLYYYEINIDTNGYWDFNDGRYQRFLSYTPATNTLSNVTGLTASITELNYTDGVTSNIQTQLDDKEDESNKVTSITSSSTDTEYPSAKSVIELLKAIYPVGSVYLSTNSTCPMADLFGTWTLVSSGKALWTGDGTNGDTTIAAGLPNIVGTWSTHAWNDAPSGAVTGTGSNKKAGTSTDNNSKPVGKKIDASNSSSIYGNSSTVQPPAYVVNVWRRTA